MVRKYDDTVAYQSLSGHGLKGVDFIALSPDGGLWLIEVKNYYPRKSSHNDKAYRAVRKPPVELAANIVTKFTDSIRLIRIVDTYLRRHWWRRWQLWWLQRRRRPATDSNYWFWAEARRRCGQPGSTTFVLWLETPERKTSYDDEVAELIRAKMPDTSKVLVVESSRMHGLPFGISN